MTQTIDKPSSLPKNWKETKFGEIAVFLNGYAFEPEDWKEDGLPIIRIEQLRDENASADFFDKPLPERFVIRNGDLIFSWSASLLTRIWDRGEAYLNQHLFKVENRSNVDRAYLKHLLDFNIDAMASETHGSTMKHITRPALLNYPVEIPIYIAEQHAIADILTTVDDAIEQTEALVRKYQRIKQGLMQDLLTRGVDENGNIRNIESSTFIESRYGRIPGSWQICTLEKITEKIADRDHRTPQYVDEGIFIVSPKDFDELDNINFETCNHIPISEHLVNKKKTDLRPNDIVFTRIGAGLGKACLVTEDMPEFSILHSMAQIRPNNNIVQPEYLLYSLRSFNIQKQIMDGIQSIGVPDLGLEKIKHLEILLPTINEQERISTVLASNDNIIKGLYSELKKISKLKQGLMQDLLTGKVLVNALLE